MNRAITFCLLLAWLPVTAANDDLIPAFQAYEARDFDQAISSLETLARKTGDRDVLFHLARIQNRAGRNEDAAETLETLFNRYPNDADAYYLSGLVNLALVGEVSIFRKISMAKKTVAAWEQAVAIDPGHINARYAIFAFYANAPGIAGGDLVLAAQLQAELEALNAGYGAMASGLLQSKDDHLHEKAEASFIKAAQLMDRAGPHFALAQFYMQTEQYEKALNQIDLYNRKEQRWWDPDITVVHLVVARANSELGNIDAARETVRLALSLKPNKQIKGMLEDLMKSLR